MVYPGRGYLILSICVTVDKSLSLSKYLISYLQSRVSNGIIFTRMLGN